MVQHWQRECDPRLWGRLLGRSRSRREEAVRTIKALEAEEWYARQLLERLPSLQKWQRANVGDALSLLGDPRFSPPYYLSEMLAVPDGQVILGSSSYPAECPVHAVGVAFFSMAQFPVIQAAYAAFVKATGHRVPRGWPRGKPSPDRLNAPVVFVSARDAGAYCEWLSSMMGETYRLPTEAEWVLAARGAESARPYPWGVPYDDAATNAWGCSPLRRLCAVGLYPEGRGPYGHDDLAGNAWEWCSSLYWPYPYRVDDGRENPESGDKRVVHGGSWRSRPCSVRCSTRQGEPPGDRFSVVGFRIVKTRKGQSATVMQAF